MKQYRKFAEHAVIQADLPGESLPNQPLLEIMGDNRVLLENHLGVICYGDCEIKVRVKYGAISVRGKELQLTNMTRQQLIIIGRIDSVSIVRDCL